MMHCLGEEAVAKRENDVIIDYGDFLAQKAVIGLSLEWYSSAVGPDRELLQTDGNDIAGR